MNDLYWPIPDLGSSNHEGHGGWRMQSFLAKLAASIAMLLSALEAGRRFRRPTVPERSPRPAGNVLFSTLILQHYLVSN